MKLLARVLICIFVFGFCLYSCIDKQNELTKLRMQIPDLVKEIRGIEEENTRLQYEIDQFENPQHLMQLARLGEFSHLKHPLVKEVITVPEGIALLLPVEKKVEIAPIKPKLTLASTVENSL